MYSKTKVKANCYLLQAGDTGDPAHPSHREEYTGGLLWVEAVGQTTKETMVSE